MDFSKYLADRVLEIPRSGIRDFFEVVQTMTDVISLGIGEPDYVTPWRIREAAIFAMEKGKTGYTSNLGTPRLRQAVAKYIGQRCGINYNPSVLLSYGKPVPVRTSADHEFRLLAEDLERVITPRSKALLLSFPTNPTGGIIRAADLKPIADLCRRHDLIVLSDEIYSELTYDGSEHISIASLPGMKERTVLLNGCSKSYAMTGFRVGYACAPGPIIEAMMKIHQYAIMCASNMSQEAAIEALENCQNEVETMRNDYERRRNFVVNRLNGIGLPCHLPKGAFYAFPSVL